MTTVAWSTMMRYADVCKGSFVLAISSLQNIVQADRENQDPAFGEHGHLID